MSWRGQGITGSNNIPLGNRRRLPGDTASPQQEERGYNPTQPSNGFSSGAPKRGRSPVRGKISTSNHGRSFLTLCVAEEPAGDGTRRRKKRNRWGDQTENKAAGLMGLPTAIMANMTSEQLEAYTLHLRIEEISQKLRIDDVVPADGDRSVIYFLVAKSMLTRVAGLHLLHHSTTTSDDVSIPESIATESVSKTNAIN
jgi:splicing factor 1